MPIPEYQASSGAIIYKSTPEELALADATKKAKEVSKQNEELSKQYNELKSDYDSLQDKYNELESKVDKLLALAELE